ncbi:MAG: hypothetical protein UT84_C0005G0034 [Candidatus Curtissbacteria bacterium GW2011_GWA1_40_16]|uniref:Uncharacterized protein n=1 Tax=Candidatus Curtissbacteria bacterium GW2011_GWA1_40_16 TaxID=1618405 RepID=A0A0G0REL7_9BACT|nr:MAG: hypothetical protein UT84_C0005G0034 [Candidatus Curtissbacteria bacterium GW2011_GWA1_40_16]
MLVAPSPAATGGRLSNLLKIPAEQPFSNISQVLFLASVVVVLGVCLFFLGIPSLQKGSFPGSQSRRAGTFSPPINVAEVNFAGTFSPPINVAEVNFTSEFQQDIFLKNFQDAGKTSDYQERYRLLLDNYSRLLGFYAGDHDPKTRKVLEQYAQYMISYYPERAQESIYTVPCFDSGCGTAKYPQEIQKIKADIEQASASAGLKESLDKNFDAAALSSDKNFQWSTYVNALSSVKSVYDKNKDEATLSIYKELAAFIEKAYPDYKIPPQIRMGQ